MKKTTCKSIFFSVILVLCLILPSCQQKDSPLNEPPKTTKASQMQNKFEDFLMEEFQNAFENDLLMLHYTLKNPEAYDIEKPETAFSPLSEKYNAKCKEELEKTKSALSTIDKTLLTQNQQILYDTLDKYLEQQIALSDYTQFLHVLGPTTGISSTLPLTLAEYTFYTEEDVKDYLSILPQVPGLLNEAYHWEENLKNQGYCLSDFEIEDTIKQIDTFLGHLDDNLLITTFHDRMEQIDDLSGDQKKCYITNNRQLISTIVIPAFETLKADLTRLKKSAPEGKGLSCYENGSEYYELLIQSMTMSDRNVDTLIKTIEKRLNQLIKRIQKVSKETPEAYKIFYHTSHYSSETPEQMLNCLKECMKKDYPDLDDITYRIEPIPDALKNNTTAAYYMVPPLDSATENRIYYSNTAGNSASLFMTLAHEGYPGHLYHQNYMLKNGLHPIYYVLNITGYKEAWAYYIEIDTADYYNFGSYDEKYHDALTELHRCDLEFSYAISCLVDLYVNGKGYTEPQIGNMLIKYGLDSTSAKAFFEYAIEEPGAYLQYYVGYLELLTIRQNKEKALGNSFNEKAFHKELLDWGPCYFDTLSSLMNH